VGTAGHERAKRYLVERLNGLQLEPYTGASFELPYTCNGIPFTNLVGRWPGQRNGQSPLLIGAHYDTCGSTPGADDNAAAVAIVLEAAERLKARRLDRDVVVAIFDAEEPPHFLQKSMGSTTFYSEQRREKIECAFILDLVGHDIPIAGMEPLVFITGMEGHQELEQVMLHAEPDPRIKVVTALNAYVGDMSDHHVFRMHGVPYLFFSCGRWEHYHMPTDTPDKLNFAKMEGIAETLTGIVERCDRAEFLPRRSDYDSTATDLLFMQRSLGPVLQAAGMVPPRTRDDLDHVAGLLLSQFRL
jgi:hypothetical protein